MSRKCKWQNFFIGMNYYFKVSAMN